MRNSTPGGPRRSRGQALVEFALCSLVVVALMLGVIEFGRMVLAYTTVSNAARIGVRFAMTHGSDNSASTSTIQSIVKSSLGAAAIDTSSATVTVSYPGSAICVGNGPGCPVIVTVSYPYQTMFTYYPIHVTLSSESEGVITF
jgi:Flp pilus assembly protein TadG